MKHGVIAEHSTPNLTRPARRRLICLFTRLFLWCEDTRVRTDLASGYRHQVNPLSGLKPTHVTHVYYKSKAKAS